MRKKILKQWTIEPNYQIAWGQKHPEGELFDNGLCGCTNVALAICLSYINKPSMIQLTYPNHENDKILINWTLLKGHKQSFSNYFIDNCHNNTHNTLSQLCRELGHRNNSQCYWDSQGYPTGTGTFVFDYVIPTLKGLGVETSNFEDYVFEKINNYLNSKNIIFATAENYIDGKPSRHSFVIDGVKYEEFWSGEYIREYGKDWELTNDHGIQYVKMTHVNWGWNGLYNGFFGTAPFCASVGSNYDYAGQQCDYENYKNYIFQNVKTLCIYK